MTSDNFLFLSGPGSKIKLEGGNMSKFPEDFLLGIASHLYLKKGQVALAQFIAEHVHAQQTDKAGKPYISHPARVVENLLAMPDFDVFEPDFQEAAIVCAWLHDVLEDSGSNGFTKVTAEDLRTFGISELAIGMVSLLTRPESVSPASQSRYYEEISGYRPARFVKWSDIADNLNEVRLSMLSDDQVRKARAKYAHALESLQRMTPEQERWFQERVRLRPTFD